MNFRVWASRIGLRAWASRFGLQGLGFKVWASSFGFQGLGSGLGLGFEVLGLGCIGLRVRVWDLAFRLVGTLKAAAVCFKLSSEYVRVRICEGSWEALLLRLGRRRCN